MVGAESLLPLGRVALATAQQRKALVQPFEQLVRREQPRPGRGSSMASGKPSSRRQISRTASIGSVVVARWRNSSTASFSGSGCDRVLDAHQRCAAGRGWWQATSSSGTRPGRPTRSDAASVTCSKLSNSRSIRRSSMCSASGTLAPSACSAASITRRGSRNGASGTQKTPSGKSGTNSAAAWRPSLVLPVPPGPVSVTRRTPSASEVDDFGHLALAADQLVWLNRQIRGVERAQGRELAVAHLVKPLRRGQVLESMKPQVNELRDCGTTAIAERVAAEMTTCPPCAAAADARGAVDIDAH